MIWLPDCLCCMKPNETVGGAKGQLNVPVSMKQDSGLTSIQTSSSIILMGQTELNSDPNFTFYPVKRFWCRHIFSPLFFWKRSGELLKRSARGGRLGGRRVAGTINNPISAAACGVLSETEHLNKAFVPFQIWHCQVGTTLEEVTTADEREGQVSENKLGAAEKSN